MRSRRRRGDQLRSCAAPSNARRRSADRSRRGTEHSARHRGRSRRGATVATESVERGTNRTMGFDQYHEPPDELSDATRTFARMIASMTEEAEAIGWTSGSSQSRRTDRARVRSGEEFNTSGWTSNLAAPHAQWGKIPGTFSSSAGASRSCREADQMTCGACRPTGLKSPFLSSRRVLESLDRLTALQTARKERVDRARDRVEDGIVVAHWALSVARWALSS